MAESVQNTYRRNVNPFTPGQIANGRDCQIESGRLVISNSSPGTMPFGYAVGWVDGPGDTDIRYRNELKGHVCARRYVVASNAVTNFAGVAVKNVALPGDNSPVDTYNEDDLVSIGSEGDFVARIYDRSPDGNINNADNVSIRGAVYVVTANTNTGGSETVGMLTNNATVAGVTKASVDGAIFMTDSIRVTPYSGGNPQLLAVVRIRQQPR